MDITVIKQKYIEGTSIAQLSRDTGISAYRLKKILIQEGINIRSKEEQNKYSPQNQRKICLYRRSKLKSGKILEQPLRMDDRGEIPERQRLPRHLHR